MKPFIGIDQTTDKHNEQPNGEELLAVKPSAALTQSLEQSSDTAEETLDRTELPLPLRILRLICGFLALVSIGGLLGSDASLSEGYHNAPYIFWIGGISLVIWLLLKLFSKLKEKAVLEEETNVQAFSNLEGVSNAIFTELAVPPDAKEVDVLSFFYKTKGDKIVACEKFMQMAKYINLIFRVYSDSESLYLVNLDGKYVIPRSSIRALHTVKKHISMMSWNKDEAYDKGIYKQYHLTTDNYGCVHCKYYHILEFTHNNETYGIYIPCYERSVFEELTGIKAQLP